MKRDEYEWSVSQIRLLYEISLAIGSSLDLEKNCAVFLRTLLPVKNFDYGAVWLKRSVMRPAGSGEEAEGGFVLAYGMPAFRLRELSIAADHPLAQRLEWESFFSVDSGDADFSSFVTESGVNGGVYAIYALKDIGFLKLYSSTRQDALSYPELNQLRQVVDKFAVSILGCLAYRDLQVAIAQRESALESLRQSEALYRSVVESARDGIVVLREGRVLLGSREAARMLGLTAAQLAGRELEDFVVSEHVPAFHEYVRRRLEDLPGPASLDIQMQSLAGGARRDVWITANRIEYEGGSALLAILHDVTEKRQMEREKERLARALEQASEPVMITDRGGHITYVNQAFENWWEKDHQLLLGETITVLAGENPETFYEIQKSMLSGACWRGTLRHRRRSGQVAVSDTTVTPLCDEAGLTQGYVFVQRDITRELQLQERYYQAQKMESVGRLAGGISHEFNNIMTAILGFASLLLEEMGPQDSRRGLVEQILTVAERASNLTRQLLAFSRKTPIQLKPVDLHAVIRETCSLLRGMLGEDIEQVLDLCPDEVKVRADWALLQQVIMNLAVNARDAMPRGGRLSITTRVREVDASFCRGRRNLRPGRFVELVVSDTGSGMTPDVLARAFDPFFSTKPPGVGNGLGLSTVYGIVEQCGGHIEIESLLGQGTTVRIWLPLLPAEEKAVSSLADRGVQGGAETILVVEDDAIVRNLTVRLLRDADYTVLEAPNGREALDIVERLGGRVDLVLSDVVMPEMSGPELGEKILRKYPSTGILYMTGFSDVEVTEHGKKVPEERILLKPFSRHLLLQRVRWILDTGVASRNKTDTGTASRRREPESQGDRPE